MDTLQSLFERKNFLNLLQLLYQEKTVRQKDVAEALGISQGVVSLNMNELVALGFIQQHKEGRCKTYRLLDKGAEYYEANYLLATPPEAEPASPVKETIYLQDSLTDLLSKLANSLAEVEQLAASLRAHQDARPQQRPVTQGKHFDTILRLLYQEKTMLKKDLSEKLGISMGNTFVHIKEMVAAGYVEEGRDRISRTYRLSHAGALYCEEHHLAPGRKAMPLPTEPQKSAPKGKTVLNEKNFTNIMQVLYESGDMPLAELCARLDRPHGNVYRDMQNLTLEGFVKKETVKHRNYYALSEMGQKYCESHLC